MSGGFFCFPRNFFFPFVSATIRLIVSSKEKFKDLLVRPGSRARLKERDTDSKLGLDKDSAQARLEKIRPLLDELQYRLYAEHARSVLVVLQGMDTSGKDGTVRHVFEGMNPQGCRVVSFKKPSEEELSHDYLWRVHAQVPPKGILTIFNRSHYEDVLAVRVHGLVPEKVWSSRYQQINVFEKYLAENGVTILKFFLHISRVEQGKRLEERLKDSSKRWKYNAADLRERKLWKEYARAYEDAVTRCSTPWAPWRVIPSDHKWVRNLAVSEILFAALKKMKPRFPRP